MKTIGIIGGLGPMATVYYLELITRMTDADKDQEHPRILLESLPDTPDRTAYILKNSTEDPLPVLVKAAQGLEGLGADLLTIPCITAHYFYDAITEQVAIPIIHLPRSVAQDAAAKGIRKMGILATTGTIQSRVLEQELAVAGIETLVPNAEMQKQVMQIIYEQVKKGAPIQWDMVRAVTESLMERGAEKLVLGCTELPLLKRDMALAGDPVVQKILIKDCIDVLEVLAQHAVLAAEVPLKEEYRDII